MSISQKVACAQVGIFGALVIGWVTLFIINGTILYWQDETMKMIFYWLNLAAFVILVGMYVAAGMMKSYTKTAVDERDKAIYRKALLWATSISYSVVIALLVVLTAVYMNNDSEAISVYFPQFLILTGGVTLVLTQAIASLILYGRGVNHAES
jgi:hypothetical protein